jgi:Predicted transcriptional regulator
MAPVLTEAERIRVSEDMVGVTADLVSAMLRSKMISKDRLPGHVRDIHRALIDISADSVALLEGLGMAHSPSPPVAPERKLPSADAIKQAVDQLLDTSSTVFEPPVPYQVRVPQTQARPSPRPEPVTPKVSPDIVKKAEKPQQPSPSVPVQSVLPLEDQPSSKRKPWTGEERRARPVKGKSKAIDTSLPPRLSSIEEAITLDYIVCLEDGRRVKHLGDHLAKLGMTPDQYREKWKLPPEYPMMAPNAILRRADVYEIDLVTGKIMLSR